MLTFSGKSVLDAAAVGKISVFKRNGITVKREYTEDTEGEKKRFEQAKERSVSELDKIYRKALREVGEANAQIFEIHRMMIADIDYNDSVLNIIETQKVSAQYAIAATFDNFAEKFSLIDDPYMRAREADVRDISDRLIRNLTGEPRVSPPSDEKMIIFADDLAPSETVSFDRDKVLAFVTARGS